MTDPIRALVLGSTGMLGVQVCRQLERRGIAVVGTTRGRATEASAIQFDAERDDIRTLLTDHGAFDYIVNAIGIIKPYIHDGNSEEELRAIAINAVFPHRLAEEAARTGAKVIQIATDCTFSGREGLYSEKSPHDALDVYGKTKSLGEVTSDSVMHIRSSIIGREYGRSTSLVEWVIGHEKAANVSGYTNHLWNGVTTNVFGRVCAGIIKDDLFKAGTVHLVPSDIVTKYELVRFIADSCGREDLSISPTQAEATIDRTLATLQGEFNHSLWAAAGFESSPSVEEIVATLSEG